MLEMRHSHTWHEVRKLPSGKFWARWVGEAGKIKSKTFLTKAQAEKYAWDQANGVLNVMLGLAVSNKGIDEAMQEFLGVQRNPKTNALYERRLAEFCAALPELKSVGQITDTLIHKFHGTLIDQGHNPGGQSHHLRIVRTFCRYCVGKNWLAKSPFSGGPIPFKMPTSEYEGRALLPAEFDRMISVGWQGSNQYSENEAVWRGTNQFSEVDFWLNRAIRFGKETMLRISQVWELQIKNFKEPNELWVRGIKGQDGEWKFLRPEAVNILRELAKDRAPEDRFFSYWTSVGSMQGSVKKKARRVGLKGVRFHDACKVTRVSELDAAGMGLGDLSEVSNTTKRVLSEHYIKTDRRKAFERYLRFQEQKSYQLRISSVSKSGSIDSNCIVHGIVACSKCNNENSSSSPQVSEL